MSKLDIMLIKKIKAIEKIHLFKRIKSADLSISVWVQAGVCAIGLLMKKKQIKKINKLINDHDFKWYSAPGNLT